MDSDDVSSCKFESLNVNGVTFMVLFWSARRWDQLPPLELIMYAPCPTDPNTKPYDLDWIIFLWHSPIASQLLYDYFILKENEGLFPPTPGSIMANLYAEFLIAFTVF